MFSRNERRLRIKVTEKSEMTGGSLGINFSCLGKGRISELLKNFVESNNHFWIFQSWVRKSFMFIKLNCLHRRINEKKQPDDFPLDFTGGWRISDQKINNIQLSDSNSLSTDRISCREGDQNDAQCSSSMWGKISLNKKGFLALNTSTQLNASLNFFSLLCSRVLRRNFWFSRSNEEYFIFSSPSSVSTLHDSGSWKRRIWRSLHFPIVRTWIFDYDF